MTTEANKPAEIIQTDRGLTLKDTQITLYDLMDYVKAQYPPHLIQGLFNLTDEQINTALAYLTSLGFATVMNRMRDISHEQR